MWPLFEIFSWFLPWLTCFSWNCFINLFSWTSDMFVFYLCVHHKCASCPKLIPQRWQACGLLLSWTCSTSNSSFVFLWYVFLSGPIVQTSYHRSGRHVAFYFHELVQHTYTFLYELVLHQTPPLCLPFICVLKWASCPNLISQRWQACGLLFSWTCST